MIQDYALEEVQLELLRARQGLRAAVEAVPEALRTVKPGPGRWSVAEVVEHVSILESRVAAMITALAPGAPELAATAMASATELDRAPFLDRSVRVAAPEVAQPQGQLDARGAWDALERAWAIVDGAFIAASGRDLTTITRPHPVLGPLDGYQWLAAIGAHEERHTAQIVEAAEILKNS